MHPDSLVMDMSLPLRACNTGLFISRGRGSHPERVIDSHELILVERGTLGMYEEDRRFDVRAGESLILWPGRRHGGTAPYPADLRFYWIHFNVQCASETDGPQLLRVPQHAAVNRPDRLIAIFRRFLDDQESGDLSDQSGALMIMLMLHEVQARPQATAAGAATLLAQRAHTYIRTHFDQPITTSGIAQVLGCDADYLGRVYRVTYGRTCIDAIHSIRLRKACSMLMDDERSIKQIARACGFGDAGYFRRTFKRREGLSPLAYRKLYARLHVTSE